MTKNNNVVDKLMEIVRNNLEIDLYSNGSLNTIIVLTELAKDSLPSKFIDIVEQIRESNTDRINDSEMLIFHLRLIDIFEVFKEFSNEGLPTAILDEYTPIFALDKDEIAKILSLCSKMRQIICSTHEFDQSHKVRLLDRISAMEAEIHKDQGRFDVFLAGLTDFGDTINKFGTSIKPLTDRMAEVVSITRSKTKAYDQIPAPEEVKKIEDKSGDE